MSGNHIVERCCANGTTAALDVSSSSARLLVPFLPFLVAGRGAVSDELEAVNRFFGYLPPVAGLAWIVVHCSDSQYSGLVSVFLCCMTHMPVFEEQSRVHVLPERFSVILSAAELTLEDAYCRQRLQKAHGERCTMPTQCCSVAKEDTQSAVAVLLSGMYADGVGSLQAMGGPTFIHDGLSLRAAHVTRSVGDTSLSAERARERANIYGASLASTSRQTPTGAFCLQEHLLTLLWLTLCSQMGVDVLLYKPPMPKQRLRQRMAAVQLADLVDYADNLVSHQDKVKKLSQRGSTHRTTFLRSATIFDVSGQRVFPEIIASHLPDSSIRIWVAKCSTGEAACSLAIHFSKFLKERSLLSPIQSLASGINLKVQARSGVSAESLLAALPSERLEHCFALLDLRPEKSQIARDVRTRCMFAQCPMGKDPPFLHPDQRNSRNLLISLGKPFQHKSMQTFYSVLAPHGVLLPGTSGKSALFSQLFAHIERLQKRCRKGGAIGSQPHSSMMDAGRAAGNFSQKECF